MATSPEEIRKHIRLYWLVGATLCVFTVITVAVSLLTQDFGGPQKGAADIVLALAIATFKAGLVALIFMHLSRERGVIYKTLFFTVVFAAALMVLTLFAQSDPIRLRSPETSPETASHAEPRAILQVGQ